MNTHRHSTAYYVTCMVLLTAAVVLGALVFL